MVDPNLSLTEQDAPLTEAEKKDVVENAAERLRLAKNRFLKSAAALLTSCGLAYLFLDGHARNAYWTSACLIWVSLGLLVVCVNYGATAWIAWAWLRDLKNDKDPTDRWD